jgi:hypothetical protein
MREVVRYIVQAKQPDGTWKTIRNTTSYQKAVMASKKADNRRLMVQRLVSDRFCWQSNSTDSTFDEWQAQSDAERDAVEMARRQR